MQPNGAERVPGRPSIQRRRAAVSLAVVGALGVPGTGCGEAEMTESNRPIEEVLAAETNGWMSLEGVQGTALGLCDGEPCIVIYATDPAVRERFEAEIEGHRIDVRVTGEFRALDTLPGSPRAPEP